MRTIFPSLTSSCDGSPLTAKEHWERDLITVLSGCVEIFEFDSIKIQSTSSEYIYNPYILAFARQCIKAVGGKDLFDFKGRN